MITYLSGRLIEKNPSYIVLDVQGVGYFIHISLQTFSSIGKEENCKILTYFSVKEDSQTLYGFMTSLERDLFKQLISVSGVGTSTARIMLSSLSSNEIIAAITTNDVDVLKSVKGIGAKTAQRIILDLKDKLAKNVEGGTDNVLFQDNTIKNEALSALLVLGFDKKVAEKVIGNTLIKNPDIKDVSVLIKLSLKSL